MLDPADCGPAFIGLPQDVQAEAYDYPEALFRPRVHELRRQRPDRRSLDAAVAALRRSQRPLLVAGGGVHYSLAEDELARFAEAHGIPVVETVAGKSSLLADHPCLVGPLGVTGADHANRLAAEADLVLAVGTRLQDFTTGSWTVFGEGATLIALNAARFRDEALRPAAGLRRAGRPRRARAGAGRLGRGRGVDRARAGRGGRFQGVRRRDDAAGRHARADLRPGDRRRQPGRGPGRLRPDRRRRPPRAS